METWDIGLAGWIMDDEAYDDFHRSQVAEFAIEFYAAELVPSEQRAVQAIPLGGGRYQVTAEVVYAEGDWVVVDFGSRAYMMYVRPLPTVGTFVEMGTSLSIDPYFYLQAASFHEQLPSLVYTFGVNEISLCGAPRTASVDEQGKYVAGFDYTRTVCISVESTAEDAEAGRLCALPPHASVGCGLWWILHCTRLDVSPKRTSISVL